MNSEIMSKFETLHSGLKEAHKSLAVEVLRVHHFG